MDRYLCHCKRCGKGGQSVSRTTYQRHSNCTDSGSAVTPPPPPSTSFVPPILANAENGGHGDPPDPDAPPGLIALSQTPQINPIGPIQHLLSQKRANFDFPSSIVFAVPPSKDSNRYQLRVNGQLLLPNSYHPLSIVHEDSLAVVSYEYSLVEYLDVLNAFSFQDGNISASEVEIVKDEILDTLRYLDRRKGDEWDKQLCAQLNPNTFIISGEDNHAHAR